MKRARIAAGYRTAKEFAEKNDIPQPTYANQETGVRGLLQPVAERYALLLGVSVGWLLTGEGIGLASKSVLAKELSTVSVPVIGAVQAGHWAEALEWPQDEIYQVPFYIEDEYRNMRTFALKVCGPSMNKKMPDGAHILCVKLWDWDEEPRNEDYVVVQRRNNHGLIEATVKLLKIDGAGKKWLWPESDDPEFQTPLRLDGGEDLEIWATVLYYQASVRPRADSQ